MRAHEAAAERPASAVATPKSCVTSGKAPMPREPVKDPSASAPAARRRTEGRDVFIGAPKESAPKRKPQSPGDQAAVRTPRDPASPSGGATGATAAPAANAQAQVQQKGSPQRRRSPVQDEESSCQPAALMPLPFAAVGSGSGAGGSPGPSGGVCPSSCVTAAAATTSPQGDAKVRELESWLSASTKAQVREVEARLPASSKAQPAAKVRDIEARLQSTSSGKASPPRAPRSVRPPPGLAWPGAPPGLDAVELVEPTAEASGETDSFDEEVELLRCQADLVEAAAELGTTSADDDYLTTDPDLDDDEDGISALPSRSLRALGPSVVIEEDEEGITDDGMGWDDGVEIEVDGSEMRSRLWAQSLLRLKRSIDEIYSLCEYESDEIMCAEVKGILMAASQDFDSLVKRFETQQEYTLLPAEFPLKTGVAWTTRTPKASIPKSGESPLEVLERAQSPSSISGRKGTNIKRRSSSCDPQKGRLLEEQAQEDDVRAQAAAGGGTGEAVGGDMEGARSSSPISNREDQLQSMVQSALERIQIRLGRSTKATPEELSKRSEERHRRAQQLRAEQEEQRMHQLRQLGNRVMVARERRQQREQQMQVELLEKMTRARRQYQDQLRSICERARNENRKTAEVAYITKEALKSEKEIHKQKQENARLARALLREQMRKKLIQSANRVAKVSENKRRQQETWQLRVEKELEEKERLASQRRKQHIHSIRVKSKVQETHSETVREKQRQIQEEDERTVQQNQQDFVHFRSKNIGRLALNVEGLPDGVRQEVSEQLQAAVPQPSGGRGRTARAKAGNHGRCCTPPRRLTTQSESLKSSPKSDAPDFDEDGWIEDVEPQPAQANSSKPRVHDRKSRKAPVKTRATAKATTSSYTGDSDVLLVDDVGSISFTNAKASLAVDNDTCAGTEETRRDMEGTERHRLISFPRDVSPGRTSDGTDDEASSDQEGVEAGDGDMASLLPTTPQMCDGSGVNKLSLRPKAKADHKDAKQRRSTSPPDAGTGQVDNDQLVLGIPPDCQNLETLRKQLSLEAFTDEEALKIVLPSDVSRSAAVNAAHRARISKLATDLGRVIPLLGNTLGATEESSVPQLGAHSIDLERADAVLSEFCKVLDQSQREADYALVLQLGCVGKVMDICSRIKDSMGMQSSASERNMPPAMKQLSSVMLSALKWLGLLSKQKTSRVFFLLTNRVVLLADVAVACLATVPLLETQSMPSLFLPQVLHILSLHVKQTLPDSAACFRQKLISYLLVCGLSEKLRDLFKGACLRGMRLFDGASPVPLLMLRAMCFLGTMVSAYRRPGEVMDSAFEPIGEEPSPSPVLQVLRRTDLFGIVSLLGMILFPEKGKPPSSQASERGKLPQTVISLSVQAVRILNHVARIHLETLQEALGDCQQEFYHLLVCLLDYCTVHQGPKPGQGQQDESELLHESVVLLGNYCLLSKERQALMCYGEGQTLLTKITSLPLYYFMDEKGKLLLFPTILATCFESEQNLELLRNEMNLSLLRNFLTALLEQKDDARLPEAAMIAGRFPSSLWPRALEFFSDEASVPQAPS